jgi:hypothetical protein
MALQDFDYTLHFVKGSQNTIADAMSRLCPNLTDWHCLYRYRPSPKMVCHAQLFTQYHLRRMINSRHFRCVTTPSSGMAASTAQSPS